MKCESPGLHLSLMSYLPVRPVLSTTVFNQRSRLLSRYRAELDGVGKRFRAFFALAADGPSGRILKYV